MKKEIIPRSLFFLAGVASGVGLGYYLHTEKGRALRELLNENWENLLLTLGEQAQEQLYALVQNLNATLENGLLFSDDEAEQEPDQDIVDDIEDQLEAVEAFFESGMEKARARLHQKFVRAGLTPEQGAT